MSRSLDVRALPNSQRHPAVFNTFENLLPGDDFVLVHDHDPKSLHYQLQFQHQETLSWNYLEKGPSIWRVKIQKRRYDGG